MEVPVHPVSYCRVVGILVWGGDTAGPYWWVLAWVAPCVILHSVASPSLQRNGNLSKVASSQTGVPSLPACTVSRAWPHPPPHRRARDPL